MSLKVENFSFSYRGLEVLKNISFEAKPGNLVCVLGKNGAGKSTLFSCILGILPCVKGRIMVNGTDVRSLSVRQLAQQIAYIPQNQNGVFAYTVLDMVLMGTTARLSSFACPGERQRMEAQRALETVHISHLANRSYRRLSGGERQLVLVARAIAQQAGIIVMDEPCSNLDYGNQVLVMEHVRSLAQQGYLVMLSTHNPDQAFLFADQVLVLKNGKVECFGSPELLDEQLLQSLYGIPVELYRVGAEGRRVCLPGRTEGGGH